jgi:hypothetical protein
LDLGTMAVVVIALAIIATVLAGVLERRFSPDE